MHNLFGNPWDSKASIRTNDHKTFILNYSYLR